MARGGVLDVCSSRSLNVAVMNITLGSDVVFIGFCEGAASGACQRVVIALVPPTFGYADISCDLSAVLYR